MTYLGLYFLFGAIIAVWTAINHIKLEKQHNKNSKSNGLMLWAYILIAVVWPLSVLVSVYAIVSHVIQAEDSSSDSV